MAVVWEQYAPNDSSQSLDEALDNLHAWSRGGQNLPKLPELQTAVCALTALPQANRALLSPSLSLKVAPPPSPLALQETRPEKGWVVSAVVLQTFAYSPSRGNYSFQGMSLTGATSTSSSSLLSLKPLGPRRGGPLKFPAVSCQKGSTVSGSTLEAPSCWGKKRGCGITRSAPFASLVRHSGSIEPSLQPPMDLESPGLPGWLGTCSCLRPVAGESNKQRKPPKCSRTFRKTKSIYVRWRSHQVPRETKEKKRIPQAEETDRVLVQGVPQHRRTEQKEPLASWFQSPLRFVYTACARCPLDSSFASPVLPRSSSIQTRVHPNHGKPMASVRPTLALFPHYDTLPASKTAPRILLCSLTQLNTRMALASWPPAMPGHIKPAKKTNLGLATAPLAGKQAPESRPSGTGPVEFPTAAVAQDPSASPFSGKVIPTAPTATKQKKAPGSKATRRAAKSQSDEKSHPAHAATPGHVEPVPDGSLGPSALPLSGKVTPIAPAVAETKKTSGLKATRRAANSQSDEKSHPAHVATPVQVEPALDGSLGPSPSSFG